MQGYCPQGQIIEWIKLLYRDIYASCTRLPRRSCCGKLAYPKEAVLIVAVQ